MEITEASRLGHQRLRQLALLLVWIGEVWNIAEAGVALWSGKVAGSVALLAYGLDSLIELFAGAVLIWHLSHEWGEHKEGAAEKKALRLVGITFFVLSAYIAIQAIGTLLGWFAEPRESLVGIMLVIASAVVMTALFFPKINIARKIGSPALCAEAKESLACDLQDLTLLVGLGANALWGWWWADPVAALALIPWLIKEGWEAVFSKEEEEAD
ncbi:MAG: cation transporter [Chloroflexi bacterium]|nr:cation transporter [Chloroflexota bacterium]